MQERRYRLDMCDWKILRRAYNLATKGIPVKTIVLVSEITPDGIVYVDRRNGKVILDSEDANHVFRGMRVDTIWLHDALHSTNDVADYYSYIYWRDVRCYTVGLDDVVYEVGDMSLENPFVAIPDHPCSAKNWASYDWWFGNARFDRLGDAIQSNPHKGIKSLSSVQMVDGEAVMVSYSAFEKPTAIRYTTAPAEVKNIIEAIAEFVEFVSKAMGYEIAELYWYNGMDNNKLHVHELNNGEHVMVIGKV